jgi:proline racemase
MRADRVFNTVDFHTGGIGMRLVTSGIGRLPGPSLADQRRHFQEHLDWIRTALCLPPRGHPGLLIAVMTPALSPGAVFGLLFMYPGGYYVSCGEATIGAATIALETGLVPRAGFETPVVIDTEVGPVETVVHADAERVRRVTLRFAPSYVAMTDQTVEVEGAGEVPVDISVGAGNLFALVEARRLGLAVRPEFTRRIAQQGMAVRAAVNGQLRVDVPVLGKVPVENVIIHELPGADDVSPNALVWGPGQVDAAPCGSGTCARMALLHHRGRMAVGQTLVSKGLSGLSFTARIAGETSVESRRAILPEVTGSAHITGLGQILLDPEDPVRQGFLLEA